MATHPQIRIKDLDIRNRAWVLDAACANPKYDPDLWFPEKLHSSVRERQEQRAIAVCGQCPVLTDCLIYACRLRLSQELIYGVWAGRPASWFDDRKRVRMTFSVLETERLVSE